MCQSDDLSRRPVQQRGQSKRVLSGFYKLTEPAPGLPWLSSGLFETGCFKTSPQGWVHGVSWRKPRHFRGGTLARTCKSHCLYWVFKNGSANKKESADKPGSVVGNHSSGTVVTGGLKQPTRKHRGPRYRFPIWSCSGWGLPRRRVLPPARCALTAPFHPYPAKKGVRPLFSAQKGSDPFFGRYPFCCTCRGLTPPRNYLAPCPMEPGLSSLL